jgi:transcriptional regulator with XRE-family HTH domain
MDKEKIIDGAAQHLDGTNFNELDLRRIRKAKRMSQDEVGVLAGISRNYVGQIEAGRYNTATLKTLRKVLAVYGKELVITVKDK